MVLDEVWRRIDGVEPLSGPHGGPLSRTIKLVLDPLVLRPVQHPLCAGPILTAEGVVAVTARLTAAADVLRATAAWFTVFKQVRRTLRITEGNPQDLYFQRCFELASTLGAPDPAHGSAELAAAAVRELHESTAGRTTRALKEHLTEPARTQALSQLIELAWQRRPSSGGPSSSHTAEVGALLEICATARMRRTPPDGHAVFTALLSARAGTHSGIRLWSAGTSPTARHLGLTEHPAPRRPELGATASKATLARPFDRTIHERVFTVLQAGVDRADLPEIPELVDAEIARSCAPWALLDESLRVAATAGAELALGLRPTTSGTEPETTAQQVINGRWRREAYVLQARRMFVHADPAAGGPLAAVAAELREPWQPYLRRLWVRLHGRDVRDFPMTATDELWDILDGVARSVVLDHRMRVKQILGATTDVDTDTVPAESRAS
ncbi:hypothetical protein [Nocardia sp. alder85J]|uniref:hypothetical protein n=1 Tax=Nocardia sp. alder85J TaxID=2862949 RepID=UPI001CD387A6|nr:hypothetical protein [Nocardia sp. alder85J]MCX4096358.1 hypothetical protein [Nocardia sp. alder85J]